MTPMNKKLMKKNKREWNKMAREAKIPKEIQDKVKSKFDREMGEHGR